MSTFSLVLSLLFGGAGLHLFQFVAILSRLMRRQPREASAVEGIPDTRRTAPYQAADLGVGGCPAGLSPAQDAYRMRRRRTHAARPGAPRVATHPRRARPASRRRYGQSRRSATN